MAAPRHRQVAQQRAHPVRLGADREGEALGAPHLRIVGLVQHALAGIGAPDQPIQQIEPLAARAPGSPATPARPARARRRSCRSPPAAGRLPRRASEPTSARPRAPTPARTRERVALRHPSQSVSLASTIRRIGRANPILSGFPTPGGTVCSRHDARSGSLRRHRRRRRARPSPATDKRCSTCAVRACRRYGRSISPPATTGS